MTEIPPGEVPEQSEQLDQTPEGDRLDPRGPEDVLDEGYSPPEKWSPAQRYGNTHLEEELGETLDQRIAEEEPDPFERSLEIGAGEADDDDDGPELQEPTGEVGDIRAGRLAAADDADSDLVAEDVGVDGAGAGAEEAAVHLVDEEDLPDEGAVASSTLHDIDEEL